MAETIYTIPINEAFDLRDGCPICRLRAELETTSLEYVMGAAMMEPDVRKETNRLGFCHAHLEKMIGMKNRLSLALLLESHLAQVQSLLDKPAPEGKKLFGAKKDPGAFSEIHRASQTCYVCHRVESFYEKYLSNIMHLWKSDEVFRRKFSEQPFFCLEHAGVLLNIAAAELDSKKLAVFNAALIGIMRSYAENLREDLSGFAKSFDHRNAGKPLTDSERRSVERTAVFLSGMG